MSWIGKGVEKFFLCCKSHFTLNKKVGGEERRMKEGEEKRI